MLGLNLWPDEEVEKYKVSINHPKQEIMWTSAQTNSEKFDMLMIDLGGGVQIDLAMAKIRAKGSFKYLQETKVCFFSLDSNSSKSCSLSVPKELSEMLGAGFKSISIRS